MEGPTKEVCARCGEVKADHITVQGCVKGIFVIVLLCPYDQFLPLFQVEEPKPATRKEYAVTFKLANSNSGMVFYATEHGSGPSSLNKHVKWFPSREAAREHFATKVRSAHVGGVVLHEIIERETAG